MFTDIFYVYTSICVNLLLTITISVFDITYHTRTVLEAFIYFLRFYKTDVVFLPTERLFLLSPSNQTVVLAIYFLLNSSCLLSTSYRTVVACYILPTEKVFLLSIFNQTGLPPIYFLLRSCYLLSTSHRTFVACYLLPAKQLLPAIHFLPTVVVCYLLPAKHLLSVIHFLPAVVACYLLSTELLLPAIFHGFTILNKL